MNCDINLLYKVLEAMEDNRYAILNGCEKGTENYERFVNQWFAIRQIMCLIRNEKYLKRCAEIYEVN